MEIIALLYVVFVVALVVGAFAAWIHGLVLAFQASIILGIICLFLEPSYIIFALVKWFTGKDLAQLIAVKTGLASFENEQ